MAVEKLTPKEAAAYLGYSVYSLAKWRKGDKGPRFVTCNGRIWYRRDWLDEWQESIWSPMQQKN